ncbi:putative HAUS augmin-like complex subunit 1 [Helianthus annuus]|uniref:HAUS augmin-like complex subunit 1 n=1 Tax=Helianthus annuus TaxID=4232 RepID=A0A251TR19_HELAN|nr:AUGMIN subunit 1 [Helianthus annuus]KAF5788344.1 putative HAUS augmin-like complex subunit 1 [Helianthus annuus]KAJ0515398.1 putative HAUS augmin-like complex subunit 1 [Helianthus annuus]KAJ0523910.1 putative HAUS augmin-like complex subunit 1 [Helianthus annuus]KAJ0531590.1 putative HAUS augmin-like complex subunit 1 [Helianthus annuus]KAJ0698425.1 putative HAUS augmin-like complex subunit 1 [Helianthus annuus]
MSDTPDYPQQPATELSKTTSGSFDTNRIGEVKSWLASQFDAAGKDHVPDFEYTSRSISHLHNLATISQARTQAASIITNDFRLKASEYRSQAARIREILENVGLAQEGLPANVVASSQVLANVANLLNIRDTELSSFLVAMGDVSLRKTGVEDKRAKVQKESKILLDYTRKAIARLTYLKRTLAQLEDDVAPCETQMEGWKTNLSILVSKERQYLQQYSNYKAMLNRVGYTPEISHGMLVEMAEHRKDLEKKTKPILDTLRSYQDLPPDKALAALAIEDKKRQYNAAEKYLEDVLQSALATSED